MTEQSASAQPPDDRQPVSSPWAAPGSVAPSAPGSYPPPPAHPAPTYPAPGYPAPGYAPPGYVPPGYPAPAANAAPPAYGPPPGYLPAGYPPGGYPPGGYPPAGYPPPGYPVAGPPPPAYAFPQHGGVAMAAPERVDEVPGTSFGIAYAAVPKIASGQAVGSMIAGIGSVLVSFVVLGFGLGGAVAGWGPKIAGAFGILALLLGAAALVGSQLARRAIRRSAGVLHGLRIAQAALILGIVGLAITVFGFAGALVATYT